MAVSYIPTVDGLGKYGDYSPVSVANNLVAVAGQFGGDADSPEEQVRGAFANVGKALAAAGLEFCDVIKFTTYVVGRETIPAFMATRKEVFKKIYSAGVYPPNTFGGRRSGRREICSRDRGVGVRPERVAMTVRARGVPFTHGRDQVISYPVTALGIRGLHPRDPRSDVQ